MKSPKVLLLAAFALAVIVSISGILFWPKSSPLALTPAPSPETTEPPRLAPRTVPATPAAASNQPADLTPQPPAASPNWVLIDWTLSPSRHTPGAETRAALFEASGKYPFVRVEQEILRNPATGAIEVLQPSEMVADQIIVKLREGKTRADLEKLVATFGGIPARNPFTPDTWLVGLEPSLEAVPDALSSLKSNSSVIDYAEPNLLVRPIATPNDPRYTDNAAWHLPKISAPTAWDTRTSAGNITVAVIDTGVRHTHEDLAANMWVNPAEIAGNGLDDDKNGFIDDIHGIDEFANDGNPMDENGHGTHVSGLIGAVGNNSRGVTGVAWSGVKIMALRFIGETGSLSDNVRCIDYAIAKDAKVINASYGGTGLSNVGSNSEAAAIYRAQQAGIIMVAAAGNDGTNNDANPFYPASHTEYVERQNPRRVYALNNILSIGASNRTDSRASFSNYGNTSVDLMAPGVEMWSTTGGSDTTYGNGQGTSFAAPVASGALALLRASYPNDSVSQLMQKMLAGVDTVAALNGLCVSGGRLNLAKIVPTVAPTALPTAWHRPAHNEALLGGITMRLPAYEVAPEGNFTVFQGLKKFSNPGYGTADQNGGQLFYRSGTNGTWSSVNLDFDKNDGDFQFWKATVPGSATNGVVQYYLRLSFNSGVVPTAYIYGTDNSFTVTTDQTAAQAQPFSLRDRVSWVAHSASDVHVLPDQTLIYALVGYASPDGTTFRGATHGALYYTLDGSEPIGTQGNSGSGATQVALFDFLEIQTDPSSAGEKMLWRVSLRGLPNSTNIKYRIGFWNSTTGEEQFSGYNTGGTVNPTLSFNTPAIPASELKVSSATTGTLDADYSTSKLYLDESAFESLPVTVTLTPGIGNATVAEVWTNLNTRDRARLDGDSDGIHDGIIPPAAPSTAPPESSTPYPANGYFQAHRMTASGGNFTITLNATKTGAYRLTARYWNPATNQWVWYGKRDHCVTVAPKVAREMNVYEINVLNIDATGDTFASRSTFESLTDNTRWNLDSLRALGANTLWFQPIHPNGNDGREPSGGWDTATAPYDPGSPYSVKNFFEVMEQMSLENTRDASMTAFQSFVQTADAKGVHVMLDAPFNHTAYDVELGQKGIELLAAAGLNTAGWSATDQIRNREARFFSRNDGDFAYSGPASSAANAAVAPDRNDFGKWRDVLDVYFGRYATLVSGYPSAQNSRDRVNNEEDWMNFDDLRGTANSNGAVTRAVWKYFASYVPYWLEKTGLPAGASTAEQATKGIDGLRADFGQGMPPQFWEYAINVARTHKWSFVFMTESLDGGAVTYRSNRHFDILNENIVFPWQSANNTTAHRKIFEDRRAAYGQGLVLLNNTSHDEAGYADPWQAFIRYAVGGMLDGAPMIMYGQEIGTSNLGSFNHYEFNFGKFIPHFKRYNSMQPQWTAWENNALGARNLIPAYSGIGLAREFSPALRSSNRWFLNPQGSNTPDEEIFAVAKYQSPGASPSTSDVVLAFQNLDRDTVQANTFGITSALADLLGLKSNRTYNVRNIAAYLGPDNEFPTRRDTLLWPGGKTRTQIVNEGIFVSLSPVPSGNSAWSTAPFEAQYLKIYDTTAPAGIAGNVTTSFSGNFTIGANATFSWNAVPPSEGITPLYRITLTANGVVSSHVVSTTTYTFTAPGDTSVSASVQAINPNDPSQSSSASAATPLHYLLTPNGDFDSDGISNSTDPDPLVTAPPTALPSLQITTVGTAALSGNSTVVTHGFTSEPATTFNLQFTGELSQPWETFPGVLTGNGSFSIEFSKPGDHRQDWNGSMFFRAVR